MQDAYAHCEALVRDADKDRFLAALFAPAGTRRDLYALYAFNAEIARVRELAREPMPGEIRLQWWRDALGADGHGGASGHPVAAALGETIARHALPFGPFNALIDAHAFDLYDDAMPSLSDLETYARATESTLFGLAARILGADGDAAADAGGTAYALARLMQAFPRHAARGQVYLPADLLERHGAERADISAGRCGPALTAVLAELRAHAGARLAEARRLIAALPPAAAPAFLPVAIVGPLLRALERSRDPVVPVEVPQWRRQWALWRAARNGP
jgi:15-cis-phytoene synthase